MRATISATLLGLTFLNLAAPLACSGGSSEDEGCGAYEVTAADGCDCRVGYSRDAASGSCIATNLTFLASELPQHTGVDTACTSDADCAGLDADFCESQVSNSCLVKDCDLSNPKTCSEGHHCCEFSYLGLPNLCVSARLSGGICQ